MVGGFSPGEVIIVVALVIFVVRFYKRRSWSATPKAETANALVPKDESRTNGPWLFRLAFAVVGAIVFTILSAVLFGPSDGSGGDVVRLLSRIIGAPIGYLLAPYVWNKFFAQSK